MKKQQSFTVDGFEYLVTHSGDPTTGDVTISWVPSQKYPMAHVIVLPGELLALILGGPALLPRKKRKPKFAPAVFMASARKKARL